MKNSIKFFINKTYLIVSVLFYITLSVLFLKSLNMMLSDDSLAIELSLDAIVCIVLIIGIVIVTIAMATLVLQNLKLLINNPYYVEFNEQGLNLFIRNGPSYLNVNWNDIKDVKICTGPGLWFPARWVALIPKNVEEDGNPDLLKTLRKNWQNKVIIRYMGQGKMSHKEFYSFIRAEFARYQTNTI